MQWKTFENSFWMPDPIYCAEHFKRYSDMQLKKKACLHYCLLKRYTFDTKYSAAVN